MYIVHDRINIPVRCLGNLFPGAHFTCMTTVGQMFGLSATMRYNVFCSMLDDDSTAHLSALQ